LGREHSGTWDLGQKVAKYCSGTDKTSAKPSKNLPISCKISGHPEPGSHCRRCLGAEKLLKIKTLLLDFGAIFMKSGRILDVSKGWFLGVFGLSR